MKEYKVISAEGNIAEGLARQIDALAKEGFEVTLVTQLHNGALCVMERPAARGKSSWADVPGL